MRGTVESRPNRRRGFYDRKYTLQLQWGCERALAEMRKPKIGIVYEIGSRPHCF
jgi:hypothetical protein